MARSTSQPTQDWKPTQAVSDPILNNPYDEPRSFWQYRDGLPMEEGGRRPARYYFKSRGVGSAQQSFLQDESEEDLPLVNALRNDVRRWRESGYRGASAITRDLLEHWTRTDRGRRLFFCQREAVETMIYLLELALPGRLGASGFRSFEVDADNFRRMLAGEMPHFTGLSDSQFYPRLIDPGQNPVELPLRRVGCKMATGSGKTIVMAMLIAWAFCNRGRNPDNRLFPSAVLVCAPNLTVRKRLSVLKPEDGDNYYEKFDLVPMRYREFLRKGKILVTNWHAFAPKSEHSENGSSYAVVQKGEEGPEAFTRDRLGELATRLPLLVLNDEGHHCWRPRITPENKEQPVADKELKALEKELSRDERDDRRSDEQEAKVWLAGLDRINNSGLAGRDRDNAPVAGVLACVDMSATPFFLANSGYPEGSPFPWLVSDFGLVDAIECGITKVPRLPVADDSGVKDDAGRPDPKYFRLWDKIKDSCSALEKQGGTPKPEAVYKHAQDALLTLASQWRVQFRKSVEDSGGRPFVPPVMIVVCDNTDVAQLFFERISGETEEDIPDPDKKDKTKKIKRFGNSEVFPELANTEVHQHTIRIDSKLLQKIEQEGGRVEGPGGASSARDHRYRRQARGAGRTDSLRRKCLDADRRLGRQQCDPCAGYSRFPQPASV
jgi:type III restriction enzyme